jgi:polyhydroxybutyrate depolymerase
VHVLARKAEPCKTSPRMRSLLWRGLVLAAAAACSTTSSSSPDQTPPETPADVPANVDEAGAPKPPPAPQKDAGDPDASSAGCGKTASGAGAVTAQTLTSGGNERTFHVSVPSAYDQNHRHPLLFVLHGAGDTNPENMKDWFPVEGNMPPSIAVYPQALHRTRKDGSGGDIPRWDLEGDEDLVFFDAMLATLGDAYCIDRAKVFVTGFSSGGNFSHQLGCLRQKSLNAIAPVEGPGPFVSTCEGPITVWMTHDVNDDVLPIADARDSRDFWAQTNGCGNTWTPDTRPECKKNTGCTSGKSVTYCETTGVGHNVADFAAATVGAFFSAQ